LLWALLQLNSYAVPRGSGTKPGKPDRTFGRMWVSLPMVASPASPEIPPNALSCRVPRPRERRVVPPASRPRSTPPERTRYAAQPDRAPASVNDVPMDQWTPEEISAHVQYMHDFAAQLEGTGEFVDSQALALEGRSYGTTGGRPPVTDGQFAETKDLIAGWMVIDVDSYERAIELAGELSAAPGQAESRSTSGSRCARSWPRRPPSRSELSGERTPAPETDAERARDPRRSTDSSHGIQVGAARSCVRSAPDAIPASVTRTRGSFGQTRPISALPGEAVA
jgi:hypothetical protein